MEKEAPIFGKGGTQEEKNLGWRHESTNSGREQHLRKIYGGARHTESGTLEVTVKDDILN